MKSVTSPGDDGSRSKPTRCCTSALNSHGMTRRSGSSNGSARNSTALTTLKMAAFAPIPSASVMRAMRVKAGRRASARSAILMSCISDNRRDQQTGGRGNPDW